MIILKWKQQHWCIWKISKIIWRQQLPLWTEFHHSKLFLCLLVKFSLIFCFKYLSVTNSVFTKDEWESHGKCFLRYCRYLNMSWVRLRCTKNTQGKENEISVEITAKSPSSTRIIVIKLLFHENEQAISLSRWHSLPCTIALSRSCHPKGW